MARAKVLYIGNCQAQAFHSLSGHLGLNVEVVPVRPVWELSNADQAGLERNIGEADFVFCQRVTSDFPVEVLRQSNLRALADSKLVVWPNIYFDGYFPGIGYIYNDEGQKIEGPLSEYHFDWLREGWRKGESVTSVSRIASEAGAWRGRPDVVEASLQELRDREAQVDVKISDFVANHFRASKIFHSMNHPTDTLLCEMLRRLFKFAGLAFSAEGLSTYPYTLNQIEMPLFGIFKDRYRPTFQDLGFIKGAAVDPQTGRAFGTKLYADFEELVTAFFLNYDRVLGDKRRFAAERSVGNPPVLSGARS